MQAALIQSSSVAGDVAANAARHADWIGRAASAGARLAVFPELSLSGYELDGISAEPSLAVTMNDPRLAPVRDACSSTGVTALVGAPVRLDGELVIAALAVDGGDVRQYAKRCLFGREQEIFRAGAHPLVLALDERRVAVGVCADLGAADQAEEAARLDVDAWVLGSLVSPAGYRRETQRAAAASRTLGGVVAFANHAGSAGGFASAGRSSVWCAGSVVAAAPDDAEGIVLFEISARASRP